MSMSYNSGSTTAVVTGTVSAAPSTKTPSFATGQGTNGSPSTLLTVAGGRKATIVYAGLQAGGTSTAGTSTLKFNGAVVLQAFSNSTGFGAFTSFDLPYERGFVLAAGQTVVATATASSGCTATANICYYDEAA